MSRSRLTPRQTQLLQGMADGGLAKTVAAELRLSAQTVKNHLGAARNRLGALTTTHAVAIALRRGLIK